MENSRLLHVYDVSFIPPSLHTQAQQLRMSQLSRMDEALDEELAATGNNSPALMMASMPPPAEERQAVRGPIWGGGSAFASMSFGMGRATRVLLEALTEGARHAVAKRTAAAARRPRGTRRAAASG